VFLNHTNFKYYIFKLQYIRNCVIYSELFLPFIIWPILFLNNTQKVIPKALLSFWYLCLFQSAIYVYMCVWFLVQTKQSLQKALSRESVGLFCFWKDLTKSLYGSWIVLKCVDSLSLSLMWDSWIIVVLKSELCYYYICMNRTATKKKGCRSFYNINFQQGCRHNYRIILTTRIADIIGSLPCISWFIITILE
jgi:hypothetical protein